MKKYRPFIILLLAVFFHMPVQAQWFEGKFTAFSDLSGLPSNTIQNLTQDNLGYMWIGTNNGLLQFDGYNFKSFYNDPNDSSSINGLIINSTFLDRKGHLWIGSSPESLNEYDPATRSFGHFSIRHFFEVPGNIEILLGEMGQDKKGRIYFGVGSPYYDLKEGLLYKEENENLIRKFPVDDSLNLGSVWGIEVEESGNIWLCGNYGIFRIDTAGKISRFSSVELNQLLAANKDFIFDIKFDKPGNLWMITYKGRLIKMDKNPGKLESWIPEELIQYSNANYNFNKLRIDSSGNVWMGTHKGLYFFDVEKERFRMLKDKNFPQDMAIQALRFDNFGSLWIGTAASGLFRYERKPPFLTYRGDNPGKNSFLPGWANNLFESRDGKIWITTSGTGFSGISVLEPETGSVKSWTFVNIIPNNYFVSGITETENGEILLSCVNQLYLFSPVTGKARPVSFQGLDPSIFIHQFYTDTKGNQWLCSTSGLYKKSKGTDSYKKYDLGKIAEGSDASNEITFVFESVKNGLWLCTNYGLFLYDYKTDQITRHGFDKAKGDVFVSQDINAIYEDSRGTAWIGTWQGGLVKYNVETRKAKMYFRNDGLPSMSIQGILGDEKKRVLWLSTFEGLSRFSIDDEIFSNYNIEDGIQGKLFADGSSLITSRGMYFFGGNNGITGFKPDEISSNTSPPLVLLTDLKISNETIIPGSSGSLLKKPLNETEEIDLPFDRNDLTLEFIAIHYSNPEKNRYAFKLENYDPEWRDAGNQHTAYYSQLPPGEYLFRVKAANSHGVWNEKGASLKITINPPWWRTPWAYVLYLIILALLIFASDRFFRNRIIRKEREKARLRELEQAKEIEKAYARLEQTFKNLKEAQAQLIQSEKMASLGELTAGIAHEIQNPLNFVNNFSDINAELAEELKEEISRGNTREMLQIAESIRENEKKINHHGKRADAIVKGMLLHSRSDSGKKEPVDINKLADEYLRLSYHGLRAKDKSFNASIETAFDPAVGMVNLNPQEIGRVLLNLFNNAFYAVHARALSEAPAPHAEASAKEYSISGVIAEVHAVHAERAGKESASVGKDKATTEKYHPAVHLTTKRSGGNVLIEVRDNGTGIPESIREKIFQPFFTTKPGGQGTGLGLSISYDIITRGHNGILSMDSHVGKGSVFTITLPADKQEK